MENENNAVKNPKHYQLGNLGIEVIDVIREVTGELKDGFQGKCVGDILKYVMRAHKKNGIQDYEKAQEYLTYLIEYMKREQGGLE